MNTFKALLAHNNLRIAKYIDPHATKELDAQIAKETLHCAFANDNINASGNGVESTLSIAINENYHTNEYHYEFQERAAIIEYDGKIPREWAEKLALVQQRLKPQSFPKNRWSRVLEVIDYLTTNGRDRLAEIISCGWELKDVFGCHASAPCYRSDCMGLLMLFHEGDEILSVTHEVIAIKRHRGVIHRYCKALVAIDPDQSYLYEIP